VNEGPLHRVRRVEIVRYRKARRAGRALGLVAALLTFALSGLVALVHPDLRSQLMQVVLSLAAFGLALPYVTAGWLAPTVRKRFAGRLLVWGTREELKIGAAGSRARWSLEWPDLGTAWMRSPRVIEIATASGDEALLYFESQAQAAATLAAIRAHARERRAYPLSLEGDGALLRREALSWLTPALLTPFAALLGPGAWPVAPLTLVLGWALARGERRITLGADGVLVERAGRRTYVPYREIEAVEVRRSLLGGRSLTLSLLGGREMRLARGMDVSRATLLEALLDEGLRMVERGEEAGARSAALEHDGQGVGEWLSTLTAKAARAGYRAASLDPERLLSIVRNPAADADQRIAAALALRAEPSGPARIRVAAEVSTEPEVRDALEALSADTLDEARVTRALDRIANARR